MRTLIKGGEHKKNATYESPYLKNTSGQTSAEVCNREKTRKEGANKGFPRGEILWRSYCIGERKFSLEGKRAYNRAARKIEKKEDSEKYD